MWAPAREEGSEISVVSIHLDYAASTLEYFFSWALELTWDWQQVPAAYTVKLVVFLPWSSLAEAVPFQTTVSIHERGEVMVAEMV